jgi:6,7-dimethyl-8-ribityllumazine synthase
MAEPRRSASVAIEPIPARVLIVEARYYDEIADELLAGAETAIAARGSRAERVTVPGALEIPAAIAIAIETEAAVGRSYDGVVALGCVIRGETSHYDIVAGESARGLLDLSVARLLPVGNGILTVDTEAQAWARARRGQGDKGGVAAEAMFSLIALKRRLSAGA